MADQLQLRGGTTAEHATFTGALREVTVDTDKDTLVVHDNATVGGLPLLREDLSNLPVGTIDDADISATAAIGLSKLATGALPTTITVASANIVDGTIVNADVNASAAIAGTKVAPDFGSQNIVTTGTATVASLNPTGSSVPTNGVYLPAANSVAISTNGTGRLFVDSTGRVGLGTSSPAMPLDVVGSSIYQQVQLRTNNTSSSAQRVGVNGRNYANTDYIALIHATDTAGTNAAVYVGGATKHPNQIFFSTTNTYGSDGNIRMTIDPTGNVGIGTTSPAYALDVAAAGTISAAFTSTSAENYIALKDSGTTLGHVRLGSISGAMLFNAGNSERARIDSSGRLLVGTSSTSNDCTAVFAGRSGDANGSSIVRLETKATSPADGVTLANLSFGTTGTSSTNAAAWILAGRDGGTWTNGSSHPGKLVFSTTADGASSPTERVRINSNGSLGTFTADVATIAGHFISNAAAAGTTQYFIRGAHSATAMYGGTISFNVFTNGNVQNTNNSYGAISDIKLKENIVDANSQWDDLKALQVRKYNFKEGQTHTQIGLIAQEVELVSPGLVSESPDRDEEGNDLGTVTKSVNYSVLYMKAVKALQEAMERIETLEAEVAALKAS